MTNSQILVKKGTNWPWAVVMIAAMALWFALVRWEDIFQLLGGVR